MIDWNPIAEKFREADAILIGASNGLSITEGLHLFADNAAFDELFGDFKQKYGLRCILQGMMAGWPSEEERWAFWASGFEIIALWKRATIGPINITEPRRLEHFFRNSSLSR